jgi:hypothetical protein
MLWVFQNLKNDKFSPRYAFYTLIKLPEKGISKKLNIPNKSYTGHQRACGKGIVLEKLFVCEKSNRVQNNPKTAKQLRIEN